MQYPFTKLNGLGNSFILMNDLSSQVSSNVALPALAKRVCDVNFGIGADGLILVMPSKSNDFRMVILNEDGSEAEMCGNGIRCFVRYLLNENLTRKESLSIETLAGPILTTLKSDGRIEVDMGKPIFQNDDVIGAMVGELVSLSIAERDYAYVSMGNPHAITFVDHFDFDWRSVGRTVEQMVSVFPKHTNVEFVKVENDRELTMKVWERGCGETQACGTGTCALVVAAVHTGRAAEGNVLVHLPGGDLLIDYQKGGTVRMTGPAQTVCSGVFLYNES